MEVGTLVGSITSLVTAVGALVGVSVQSRRETRVRSSIAGNLTVIKELESVPISIKQEVSESLEAALRSDCEALERLIKGRNQIRERNRPSLFVALFISAALTTPLWFLWKPAGAWGWTGFLILAFAAFLFVIVGIVAWSAGPPNGKKNS